MKSWRFALVVAVTGLLAGASNAAAPPQPPTGGLTAEADSYAKAEMKSRGIPGLAVAVVRDGRIVAAQAYGLANLELNVPVTLDTIFPIASLDKQLTASGIMLLVQGGKVRLDDEISSYFKDPPASWKGIHVAHLLSHTSGLPDVVEEELGGRPFVSYTTEQLLSNVKRQNLLFPPGTGFKYSDAGLFLSQLITEKASGMPWWRFVTERLFTPAGMTSMIEMDPAAIIKNRVSGHELGTNGEIISNRRTAVDLGPLYNDVGASIVDFARWAAALETDRVVPRALRDQMWTPKARANEILYWRDYGFGWGLDSYLGVRVVLHSGHTGMGILVLPEQRISVIVFTNLDNRFGTDAQGLALGIAGIYVPEISLLAMQPKTDPDPSRKERVQEEFVQLVKGGPNYGQYSNTLFPGIQEGVIDFATRTPHFGALQSFSFLEERDDEKLVYYRADFANARLFLRVGFDSAGKINCFQVIHV
ncbi:MAG: serine hydrolase domain-containing protein [Terriglobales bacterium]